MLLDDPNMGGGAEPDGEAFFSDPVQVLDARDGESGKDLSKATPLAACGYRKRVALFPSSKTPIVEWEIGDMARGRGDDANVRSCSFLVSRIPFLSFDSQPRYSSAVLLRLKNPSPPTPFHSQTRHLEIGTTY